MGRNTIDIASLVEELNHLKVSFISVKENFDTSTPLEKQCCILQGFLPRWRENRFTERVKDNMMLLAKNGRWLGGNTPLGFVSQKDEKVQIDDKIKTSYRLKEDAEEMKIVRFICSGISRKTVLNQSSRIFFEK